jgi:hypothetical protein
MDGAPNTFKGEVCVLGFGGGKPEDTKPLVRLRCYIVE